jgi:trichothecene 3-O-acetyltransferase
MEADFSQFEHLTDVLGSFQMIKRYSLISLYFRLPEGQKHSDTISAFESALVRVAEAFPWLAGKVVYQKRDTTHTGIRRIVPHDGIIPILRKDLEDSTEVASLDHIAKAGFPISVLDPEVVVPPIARTWATDGFDVYAPVLILQANSIRGGLILTICGNHTTMDMTGLGFVISLISQACRREDFTSKQIQAINQDRRHVIPLLDETYEPGTELDDALVKPPPPGTPPMNVAAATWANFNFTQPGSLAALKSAASNQSIAPYVSTDDAISALIWQRISLARATLKPSQAPSSTLCRTVSMRSHLNVPTYTGHLVDCAFAYLDRPHEHSLGDLAGNLRLVLRDEQKLLHHMRAFATVLDRMDDKTKIVNGARLNPNLDLAVSSYANMKCCEQSWGDVLGTPLAARRPNMSPWPSLMYIMPRDRDGGTAVAVCLAEEELEWLKGDEVLGRYARFVG